jgi:hypothetical protein
MGRSYFVPDFCNWIRFCWGLAKSFVFHFRICHNAYGHMEINSMDDIGTRMEHLADLHELWTSGIEILSRGTYQTVFEQAMIEELEIARTLLARHMAKDYQQSSYAQEINKIGTTPPPEE